MLLSLKMQDYSQIGTGWVGLVSGTKSPPFVGKWANPDRMRLTIPPAWRGTQRKRPRGRARGRLSGWNWSSTGGQGVHRHQLEALAGVLAVWRGIGGPRSHRHQLEALAGRPGGLAGHRGAGVAPASARGAGGASWRPGGASSGHGGTGTSSRRWRYVLAIWRGIGGPGWHRHQLEALAGRPGDLAGHRRAGVAPAPARGAGGTSWRSGGASGGHGGTGTSSRRWRGVLAIWRGIGGPGVAPAPARGAGGASWRSGGASGGDGGTGTSSSRWRAVLAIWRGIGGPTVAPAPARAAGGASWRSGGASGGRRWHRHQLEALAGRPGGLAGHRGAGVAPAQLERWRGVLAIWRGIIGRVDRTGRPVAGHRPATAAPASARAAGGASWRSGGASSGRGGTGTGSTGWRGTDRPQRHRHQLELLAGRPGDLAGHHRAGVAPAPARGAGGSIATTLTFTPFFWIICQVAGFPERGCVS